VALALEAAMAKFPGAPIMFKGDRDVDYKVIREVILEVTKTHVMGVSLAATQLKDEGDVKGAKSPCRWRSGSKQPMTDINVTPLIDVVLVMLIIFMVLTAARREADVHAGAEYEPPDTQIVPPEAVPPTRSSSPRSRTGASSSTGPRCRSRTPCRS
jgi:biopolymer transport protein ExbD